VRANRLDQGEIAWARAKRLKEIQMWSIIREFFAYFGFLSLLFLLAYSNANVHSFYEVQHLREVFHHTRQMDNDYTKVSIYRRYDTMWQRDDCICLDRLPPSISTGTGWRTLSFPVFVRRAGTTGNHLGTCLAFSTTRLIG
jgi:hypothetical protein